MTPTEIVAANPNATAEEVAAILNAKTATLTDSTLHGYGHLYRLFGMEAVNALAAQIKTLMEPVHLLLAGGGIDFSDAATQAQIDALEAGQIVDSQTAAALRAIGIRQISEWEAVNGIGASANSANVDAIRASIADQSLREKADERWTQTIAVLNSGTDWPAIVAIWNA